MRCIEGMVFEGYVYMEWSSRSASELPIKEASAGKWIWFIIFYATDMCYLHLLM